MAYNTFPPSSTTHETTAQIIRPTQFGSAQPEYTALVGHNRPTFDNIVEENLRRGIYLSQLNCITRAVRDPRITSRHLQVLAQIIERTNTKTGFAYPGRARLAADIVYYANGEAKSYSQASIATTISDLIEYGYIIADKRGVEGKGRALSHYATTAPSVEELQAEITAWCQKIRSQPQRKFPAQQSADVDNSINVKSGTEGDTIVSVTNSDGETRVNVDNGITVSSETDGDAGIEADGDNGIATVTGIDSTGRALLSLLGEADSEIQNHQRSRGLGRKRLTPTWAPSAAELSWVRERYDASDAQIAVQAERFRDHYIANGNLKADWSAAWRSWWSSDFNKIPARNSKCRGGKRDLAEREAAEAFERARLAEEVEAAQCRR